MDKFVGCMYLKSKPHPHETLKPCSIVKNMKNNQPSYLFLIYSLAQSLIVSFKNFYGMPLYFAPILPFRISKLFG